MVEKPYFLLYENLKRLILKLTQNQLKFYGVFFGIFDTGIAYWTFVISFKFF